MPQAFTSTATRKGTVWIVECDQHPEVRSQVRLLSWARDEQRREIAARLGVPVATVTVDVRPVLPDDVMEQIARAEELRAQASSANRAAAAERRATARALAAENLSLRDIGTILGVTHQRAHQLLHT
ncbi:hypothetical protein G1H11_16050 [Phytoactinopolyspora alkaliphila]|uniref:Uncharacterized protein n=1 Tax=Phytoactinopolyspora alkaliphila TaxID=1783498 RepID=A0A6N9YP32_9ACTN|nr:hypothetical protein [Phytoactinopolyspora alkaliphila]NED96821.1 hypothetical protein [Phytoactinopolyspora alkaliphila]